MTEKLITGTLNIKPNQKQITFMITKVLFHLLLGYDSQVPIDSMQGLDLGSQHGSQYGPMDNLEIGPHGDLNFGSLDTSMPPQQGGDNQGMTQWFDTDL